MKNLSLLEKTSSWIKHSIMLKLITIVVLMLLLLIPSSMIKSIISERQYLNDRAIQDVSAKWADEQEIAGPILTIPLIYEHGKDAKGNPIKETKNWHILPETLNINGEIFPKKLQRGIYEVVVYESDLDFKGSFKLPAINETNLVEIGLDKAFLTIGISDLRGIKNRADVKWGKDQLQVQPGSKIPDIIHSGITIKIPKIEKRSLTNTIDFEFNLDLQGSEDLAFTPLGSDTKVKVTSPWTSPSFNGNFLPDERTIKNTGFEAEWSVLQLNRNYPQSWLSRVNLETPSNDNTQDTNHTCSIFSSSAFGVALILPIDDYKKSTRSVKYAAMTISLTFLIFFLVEILNKKKIHPFQYILVGLALCLFYTLLVSITEHSNFNLAYGISTIGIVTLISLYSLSIFKMKRLTHLLVFTLIGIYGFLFVTLQMADFALLMGSIGLFIILGFTMYFTRNIDWYSFNAEKE